MHTVVPKNMVQHFFLQVSQLWRIHCLFIADTWLPWLVVRVPGACSRTWRVSSLLVAIISLGHDIDINERVVQSQSKVKSSKPTGNQFDWWLNDCKNYAVHVGDLLERRHFARVFDSDMLLNMTKFRVNILLTRLGNPLASLGCLLFQITTSGQ